MHSIYQLAFQKLIPVDAEQLAYIPCTVKNTATGLHTSCTTFLGLRGFLLFFPVKRFFSIFSPPLADLDAMIRWALTMEHIVGNKPVNRGNGNTCAGGELRGR
jgi:hypothetical protein